jgi:hypothetical protein
VQDRQSQIVVIRVAIIERDTHGSFRQLVPLQSLDGFGKRKHGEIRRDPTHPGFEFSLYRLSWTQRIKRGQDTVKNQHTQA